MPASTTSDSLEGLADPLDKGITRQEAVLRGMQQTHGEFHLSVSEDLAQLAMLYNMRGDHDKALTLLHKRLVIHEKHGPDELVGETLQELGTTYRLLSVLDIAQQHLERALAKREQCHGANSFKVAETINSLALLCQMRNDSEAAEAYQLRSLQVLLESSEPEDIESEDVPWEVYKRLKQQRGPSTAANSIKLLKGTLRKCAIAVVHDTNEKSRADPEAQTQDHKSVAFFGADGALEPPTQSILQPMTSPSSSSQVFAFSGRAARSKSDSAMLRLLVEQEGFEDFEERLSSTHMHANDLDDSSGLQPSTSTVGAIGPPAASSEMLPPFRTPTKVAQIVYEAINDLSALQARVETIKRRILAGAPDLDMEIARLSSDVDLIQSDELRQAGLTMAALVREMNRMRVKSDRARQLPLLEGPLEKKSASIFRGWERRWFTVDPKTFILSYHFSKDDFARGFAPRGGFPVSRIANILVHRETRGGHFHFDIVVDLSTRLNPHAARTYELRATSEGVLRYWVETLHYYKAMAQSQSQTQSQSQSHSHLSSPVRTADFRPGTS